MSIGRKYSSEIQSTSFCSVCGAKIISKAIFCFECGPPELPPKEPEETGITLEQAVFRIAGLIAFFGVIALVRFEYSGENMTTPIDRGLKIQPSSNGLKNNDTASYEVKQRVIASSANVRANPSMNGKIIALVEEGMILNVIEEKNGWTKVHVFEKTGWISSKLIKPEIQKNK